ncbi:MAG: DUF4392 domain-containing protein, partial [Symbiobacteriaceae bacterium]|nr:DUF4392 domain-containing protein [Symbiobacteriaceae bacterium]
TDLADAANALWQAKRILFLTGFLIASAKTGETDGPPGTLGLASACDQLGKEVCLVTDKYTEAALKEIVALFHWKQTPQVVVIEKGNEELLSYTLLTRFAPDHVVAIERPGQNIKGRYHSMSGVDFTDLVPDTDLLLYLAREQGAGISAIGDGGNEVGMGKIADFTKEHVPHGENICAAFAADHLIVAGISNWGAAALAALLSIAAQRPLLHTADLEEEMVHRLADAGLIDGATRSFTHTVDGWEMPLYTGVHQAIYAVMLENINH